MLPLTSKRVARLLFFFVVILAISIVSLFSINAAFSIANEIYSGVKVGDVDVGGLSLIQAEEKITTAFQEKLQQPTITFKKDNQQWVIQAHEIGLKIDSGKLAQDAYNVGRSGNIFSQLKEKYLTINRGSVISFNPDFDRSQIEAKVREIAKKIDREPQDAEISFDKATVTINPEINGQKVNIEKTVEGVVSRINTSIPVVFELIVDNISPSVTTKDLEGINGIISSYSTQFNPWDENRTQNIVLAAKNVDGILLKDGESFSFNKYVGLRLSQYGYKMAPVFINGKLLPDWGGGVCQVSSTLYNAALLADMAIEERTSHYRPPGYVPLGQDATVADNQLDFRFRNTTGHNVFIMTEVAGNQLKVSIFGKVNPNSPEIQIVSIGKKVLEPNTIIKQDPKLEFGKEVIEVEGQKGFQVSTYRIKRVAGREIIREHLYTDDFPAEDRIIRVGTKTPATEKNK